MCIKCITIFKQLQRVRAHEARSGVTTETRVSRRRNCAMGMLTVELGRMNTDAVSSFLNCFEAPRCQIKAEVTFTLTHVFRSIPCKVPRGTYINKQTYKTLTRDSAYLSCRYRRQMPMRTGILPMPWYQ